MMNSLIHDVNHPAISSIGPQTTFPAFMLLVW